jgi:3-deoxy-manno-octulosonate cytidylyltransferase (CMP-KDO synthetase)
LKPALGVIPARYGSRRFPGKPLALIDGRPMLQHVFERAKRAGRLTRILIATDDRRILEAARGFGAEAVMTGSGHQSGSERVTEAAAGSDEPIILNIQGDEPLLDPGTLDLLVEALQDEAVSMATLARRETNLALIGDPNLVKVVSGGNGDALYFSRAPIPLGAAGFFLRHIGIYGFQREVLFKLAGLPPSPLEKSEKLEQLRALEAGIRIKILETAYSTLSVDCPADIIEVENRIHHE